jgi:hypothetical protein
MRNLAIVVLLAVTAQAQEPAASQPKLKTRSDLATSTARPALITENGQWVIPAGTKVPIQLRQPISTKGAKPGDPIYAQTSFPVAIDGTIVIPAGTWVQGVVDNVKRAGRLKGNAELQFHLTTLIYANGYTVDIAAAIDQVPGAESTHVKEPGTVKHDSEKGKDLERVGTAASTGGQIGALAGVAARPSARGLGVGGVTGIAAGTLIGLLARGSDVRFETGTAVEIALTHAMALDPGRVSRNQ